MAPSGSATWQHQIPLFLLASGILFSLSVSPVWAQCNVTVYSGDAEALSQALPLLGDYSILPGWDLSEVSNSCCWDGIVCKNISGSVRIVNLTIMGGLDGVFPPSFGNLSALNLLDLSYNSLSGPIPENWSGLSSLTTLNLNGNLGLNGALDVLSTLKALEFLYFSGNSFIGVLPSGFENLSSLNFLDLSYNNLSGPIPESWTGLSSLSTLNLNGNSGLNGTLEVLSTLITLKFLYLSSTGFAGVLPSSFGNLSSLFFFDFSSSFFEGPIPESWSGLTTLTTLNLNGNYKLNGTLNVLSKLKTLKFLDVSLNSFVGELHNLPFGNLTSLVTLYVSSNKLTGEFPRWIKYLTKLESLQIDQNFLSGSTLPTEASDWPPSLTTLSAAKSSLIGPIPAILAKLPLLTLDLSSNRLNGSFPPEFGSFNVRFANLWSANGVYETVNGTSLDISGNNLTGEIPTEVGKGFFYQFVIGSNQFNSNVTSFLIELCTGPSAPILTLVDISNNSFFGEIPPKIANATSLGKVTFTGNLLTGNIPGEIAQLRSLTNLNLASNRLSGNIPSEFSKLSPALSELTLFSNNLTGEIPDLPCDSLLTLSANNNSLSGPLPSSLSKCPQLVYAELQFNQFSGNISVFRYHSKLLTLNLANNNFSGRIPSNIFWPMLTTLDLSYNSLSGAIPQTLGTNSPPLSRVILSSNSFSGEIPSTLFSLQNITLLDLSYNKFNTTLSSSFLNSSTLTTVKIRESGLSGSLPNTTFINPENLIELDLRDNDFSGPLPSTIGSSRLVELSLSGNSFSGSLPSLLQMKALTQLNLSGNLINGSVSDLPSTLSILDLSSNLFSGNVPSFGEFNYLTYVDLSSNQLSGSIPFKFSSVAKLAYLDFAQNNFTGTIPDIYNNLTYLTYFNVSNNFLTGQFPVNLENVSSYSNNSGLCGVSSLSLCIASPPPTTSTYSTNGEGGGSKLSTGAIVGIAVGGAVLALVIVGALCFVLLTKSKSKKSEDIDNALEYSAPPEGSFATSEGRFLIFQKLDFNLTVDDIVRTTENFNDKHLLGRGGFGSVYRAVLSDDQVFAVKRLTQGSSQGDAEFQAEMLTLGNIRHRNLVTLVASYNDPTSKECLLVYNFLPGGNLDSLLKKGVEWPTRLNVAIGVARGLKYLHHDCVPYIIHRDMKPGNILMDSEMEAHVCDFGLAKVVDLKKTHISTKLLGTIGYLAPEYAGKGQVSTKSDVFAYGVVLLQLVSGKLPTQPQMHRGMSQWAKSTPVDEVIDSKLEARGECRKEISAVLKLGIACTARKSFDRPTMEEVLHTLENLEEFAAGVKDV